MISGTEEMVSVGVEQPWDLEDVECRVHPVGYQCQKTGDDRGALHQNLINTEVGG